MRQDLKVERDADAPVQFVVIAAPLEIMIKRTREGVIERQSQTEGLKTLHQLGCCQSASLLGWKIWNVRLRRPFDLSDHCPVI